MGLISFVVSCLHTIAGLAAFVAFMLLGFYAAAVCGIISAAISAVTAQLNWLHKKGRVAAWYEYNELNQFYWLGFWIVAFGTSGFVYHAVALIVLDAFNMKFVVALIWAFIMAQSGGILMHTSHKYWTETTEANLMGSGEEA